MVSHCPSSPIKTSESGHSGTALGDVTGLSSRPQGVNTPTNTLIPTSISSGVASSETLYEQRSANSIAVFKNLQFTRSLIPSLGLSSRQAADLPGTLSELGLHLIYDVKAPVADLILVHGLGGSWLKTWSWKHDLSIFWPSWLSREKDLDRVRVFSFGYNANFRGASTSLCILDFAKDLLMSMSGYGTGDGKLGRAPILFVAHSMGGLVVKKAYVLGTLDPSYSDMISLVSGVIFLGTPHRGSNYARTLNNILAASMITNAKLYVAELGSDSPTLRDINEHFRLVCKPIRLVSFYESLKTRIGISRVMVVDRNSGVLGYSSEYSSPMNADHHNVAKFNNNACANYIALRDVIQDLVEKCSMLASQITIGQTKDNGKLNVHETMQKLTDHLGLEDISLRMVEENYKGMDGTCSWIRTRDFYNAWKQSSTGTIRLLWLTGLPGIGKTTLSRYVVNDLKGDDNDLQGRSEECQYHFFTFSDIVKRMIAYALRSIACQLAVANSNFRQRLLQEFEKTGLRLEQQDAQVIWTQVFEGIIFKMDFDKPIYWVLDGLDESDNSLWLIHSLLRANSKSCIRIFLTSRPESSLLGLAQSHREHLHHVPLVAEDTEEDVKLFIQTTLRNAIPASEDMRENIAQQMIQKASGSFVWVKLTLKTLERAWHTKEDIDRALADIPLGMQELFGRMVRRIEAMKTDNPRSYVLASRILAWATCSAEPLTMAQLATALEPEFTKLQNLEATIQDLCGFFIAVVDDKTTLIHETARPFLLGTYKQPGQLAALLNGPACHEHFAIACLTYLSNNRWRKVLMGMDEDATAARTRIVSRNRITLLLSQQPFLSYALSYWAYHIGHIDVDGQSEELLPVLRHFFDKHILSWVHACVISGALHVITQSAQYLKAYGQMLMLKDSPSSSTSQSLDYATLICLWAVDLTQVVGRFGRNLAEKPTSIYSIVPPLCPKGTMMYKTYASQGNLSVHGISSDSWDDCIARLLLGGERTISRILTTVAYFICLIAVSGEIIVCDTETCEEVRRMAHGEYVSRMALNQSGGMLVTAGIESFRVWEVSSGEQLYRIDRTGSALVMTMAFGPNDEELIVGYDYCVVISYDLHTAAVRSEIHAEEDDGEYHSCPKAMVLSPDVTKLAVAFQGRPLLIWDLGAYVRRPAKCIRDSDQGIIEAGAYCSADSIMWHPDGLSVFVLYQDTAIVHFYLMGGKIIENSDTSAKEMAISHDGNLLLTSNYAGTLSLWGLPKFQLVYRIRHKELLRDLAFSPDSRRFYDVRGAVCNVWEPHVLLRGGDSKFDDLSKPKMNTVTTEENIQSQITALSPGPHNKYFITGTDNGHIIIYSAHGTKLRKAYSHPTPHASIIALTWSPTGKYIASADNHGRILVKKLVEKEENEKWAVFPCLNFYDGEPVRQVLFHRGERLMLIAFPASDRIWNLKTKTEVWRHERAQGTGLPVWVNHPTQKNLLLCLGVGRTTVHDWVPSMDTGSESGTRTLSQDFAGIGDGELRESSQPSTTTTPASLRPHIRRTALNHRRSSVVVEVISNIKLQNESLHLEVIEQDSLLTKTTQAGFSLKRSSLFEISDSVRCFLGCYKDHVVFLNHEHWICTWGMRAPAGAGATVKRHFFLPRDCVSRSSLQLVMLGEGGEVVFPRNGELVVVKGGVGF